MISKVNFLVVLGLIVSKSLFAAISIFELEKPDVFFDGGPDIGKIGCYIVGNGPNNTPDYQCLVFSKTTDGVKYLLGTKTIEMISACVSILVINCDQLTKFPVEAISFRSLKLIDIKNTNIDLTERGNEFLKMMITSSSSNRIEAILPLGQYYDKAELALDGEDVIITTPNYDELFKCVCSSDN